jgi:flagellar hook-associated protein 1 FlgK
MALSIGLDSAVKALRAHQLAVDVASHNIANAQSPGFSRQRVLLRPDGLNASDRSSHDSLLGKSGNGVTASDVTRVRDIFLDFQARQTSSSMSQYDAFSTALGRAELTFNEPGDSGIASQLGKFFNAWHDVVNDPESPAARVALVHATTTLTSNLQRAASDLSTLRADVNQNVRSLEDEINSRAGEIASLNLQIVQVEAIGDKANDLRDRRDLLLDQLSALGQITYSENTDHSVSVYLGNHELVSQSNYQAVQAVTDTNPGNAGMEILVFRDDQTAVTSNTGKLKGLYDVRDIAIPGVLAKLDTLASNLITSVNAIHATGFGLDGTTAQGFLTGTGASTIAIDPVIAANPNKIAASTQLGTVGNGANALAIADLEKTASAALGGATIEQYYGNIVSVLGSDVSRADGMAASNGLLNSHIEAQRQGVSGVNLDEEITNMNASQHAYQAASRVISTIDEMLDVLINRTGAGR